MQIVRRSAVPLVAATIAAAALAGCNSSKPSASSTPGASGSKTPAASSQSTNKTSAASPTTPTPTPVCPLTGKVPTANEDLSRPALAVKIDNVSEALPQAGINHADVVFEELVEGGLTRLMAVFQCDKTGVVGPIRSARISDADVLALFHGSILGFSGANPSDLPPIVKHGDAVLISQDADPQYFYRSDTKAAPHNVFSSTKTLVNAGLAQRKKLGAPRPLFSYGTIDSAAKPAKVVSMSWPASSAVWTWQAGAHGAAGDWLRTQDGATDTLTNGHQVNAANVVILSVKIHNTGLHDVLGNPSPEDVTVQKTKRSAWVMRNGTLVKGTWTRPKVHSGLQLLDSAGHPIALSPGRTWVEMLPNPAKPTLTTK